MSIRIHNPLMFYVFSDTDLPDVIKVHRKLLEYKEITKPGAFNETIKIEALLIPTHLQELVRHIVIYTSLAMCFFYAGLSYALNILTMSYTCKKEQTEPGAFTFAYLAYACLTESLT